MVKTKAVRVRRQIARHGAGILTVAAIAGVVLTAFLAARAGREADDAVDRAKEAKAMAQAEETGEEADFESVELTFGETVKAVVPVYWKALLSGGVTIGCIIGAQVVALRDIAKLTATLGTATAIHKKYVENTKEAVGEECERSIRKKTNEQVAEERKARGEIGGGARVIDTGEGDERFYDALNDRFILSSLAALKEHTMELWQDVQEGYYPETIDDALVMLPINAWFDRCHINTTGAGDKLGFRIDLSERMLGRKVTERLTLECTGTVEYQGKLWNIIDFSYPVEAIEL